MKALTLTQPWATLVATGMKRIETRSWRTSYRGPLAIHAAKGFPHHARDFAETEVALGRLVSPLPLGAVLAVVDLVGILETAVLAVVDLVGILETVEFVQNITALERLYGDYSFGRYAWFLENPRIFPEPIPAKGAPGLWEWEMPDTWKR